jgi:hypothetical protein
MVIAKSNNSALFCVEHDIPDVALDAIQSGSRILCGDVLIVPIAVVLLVRSISEKASQHSLLQTKSPARFILVAVSVRRRTEGPGRAVFRF